MVRTIAAIVIFGLAFSFISCASMDQSIRLTPISSDFPISASGALYIDDRVIEPNEYTVRKSFEIEKIAAIKIKQQTVDLDLEHDLGKLLTESAGNAIVKLKVEIRNIDTTSLSWIAVERYFGAVALLVGIEEIILGSMLDYSSPFTVGMYAVAGGGAALIGGSFLHEQYGKIIYSIRISGTVVSY